MRDFRHCTVNTRAFGAHEIYTRTNGKLKAIQPRWHVATWSHTLVDQYTGAHKRGIEEDPNAHQLTFDYFRPIWAGTLWLRIPDIQYPILNWSFDGGPNDTMVFQGHCGVPPLCRSSRDRWQWFRFVNPIYGSSAQNPDR